MPFKWWYDNDSMRYEITCVDGCASYGCVITLEEFVCRKEEQPNKSMDALAQWMVLSPAMTECWKHVRMMIGHYIIWGTFEKIVSDKLNGAKEPDIDASRWKEIMQSYCKEIEHA